MKIYCIILRGGSVIAKSGKTDIRCEIHRRKRELIITESLVNELPISGKKCSSRMIQSVILENLKKY